MTAPLVADLRGALEGNAAVVHGPVAPGAVAATAVDLVTGHAAGGTVAVPADSADPVLSGFGVFDALRSAAVDLVTPDHPDWRRAVAGAAVGVTGCVAASAETGTIAVACGPGAPRAVSLTPDVHVCVVPVSMLEPELGAALARALDGGLAPNLVWISGPSRSADIEKRITLGVHGPRTFEVVLAEAPSG